MAGIADRQAVVMYVKSQAPEYHPTLDYVETSIAGRLGSMLLPSGLLGDRPEKREPASGQAVKELPLEQAQCVRLVLDVARRRRCPVQVIDVSRQSMPGAVIETRLGDTEPFPILVRPDGARLSGLAEFTPGSVRRFLSFAHRPA